MKNYFTFIDMPSNTYNFQRLMCYYLHRRHKWKSASEEIAIAHWCYDDQLSFVKKYPFYSPFTRKDLLYQYLSTNYEGKQCLPETYLLKNGKWYPRQPFNKQNSVWFCKHPYRDGSRGIIVSKNFRMFLQESIRNPTYQFVVQPTIPKPWLDQGKYKCDIRLWGVITQDSQRLDLHVFKIGTLRVNPSYYKELSDSLDHQLTNSCYFKKNKNLEHLIREFNHSEPLYQKSFSKIISQFKIFWKNYYPILKKQQNRDTCLELFGFDFLCNQEGTPFLIECNRKPNFHTLPRYRKCVETLIPTLLEPIITHTTYLKHPLWEHIN